MATLPAPNASGGTDVSPEIYRKLRLGVWTLKLDAMVPALRKIA